MIRRVMPTSPPAAGTTRSKAKPKAATPAKTLGLTAAEVERAMLAKVATSALDPKQAAKLRLKPYTAAECKALRIWDSRQAVYKRALARHAPERWQWLLREAGAVDRISKGRVRAGQESPDAWLQLERLLLAVADKGALRLLAA